MKATCQGEKSIAEHVGEYKPWKFQMNLYFISLTKFTFLFAYESIHLVFSSFSKLPIKERQHTLM